jgi:hypothetical protein
VRKRHGEGETRGHGEDGDGKMEEMEEIGE